MNRVTRLNQTVRVEVEFENTGEKLAVESRKSGRGYGRIKQLLATSREARRLTAKAGKLKRQLDHDALSDDKRDEILQRMKEAQSDEDKKSIQKELSDFDEKRAPVLEEIDLLDAQSAEGLDSLIDWMVGNGEETPGALADWDYYEDSANTQKVAITRDRIEEFEGEEIALLANKILEKMNVGESKPQSSQGQ